MATLFGLTTDYVFEIPTDNPIVFPRRIIAVETLEGTDRHDIGSSESDAAFPLSFPMPADDALALKAQLASGARLGISLNDASYEIAVDRFEARQEPNGLYLAKLDLGVVKKL